MRQFTDSAGRTWEVRLDYAALCRVRDLLGIDLLDIHRVSQLESNAADTVDTLYVACRAEISDRKFGRAMRGEAFPAARQALFEEWISFFPQPDESKPEKDNRPQPDAADIDKLVWQCAGIVGVHPGPYTLRQLLIMSETRGRADWRHTSHLLWALFNINRKPGKPTIPLSTFDPYVPREKPRMVGFDLFFADMIPPNGTPAN